MIQLATRVAAELPGLARSVAGQVVPTRNHVAFQATPDQAAVSSDVSLLAVLQARADRVSAIAGAERSASGGDPTRGDPERFRKLYPPYPPSFLDRAAYLSKLSGLDKVDNALLAPLVRSGTEDGERLAQVVSARLADTPGLGLSRWSDRFSRMNLEG